MTHEETTIEVTLFRGEPGKEVYFQDFSIHSTEPLSIMALLAKVRELDAGVACRTSTCFKGKCGSCLVRVNGQDVFGCTTLIKPGERVTIEPHSRFSLIRDIVVDFSRPVAAKEGQP